MSSQVVSTSNSSIEQLECPICFDAIDNKNFVTTECGHCFHCSCLMKNVVNNGFDCPMCRQKMAEIMNDDVSESSDYDSWIETNINRDPDDNALRSFRMFQQQIENEEIEEEPQVEDDEDDEAEVSDDDDDDEEPPLPTPAYLANKLAEKGVTMEDMVKALLLEHEEYEDEYEVFNRRTSQMYGELRRLILNYDDNNNINRNDNGNGRNGRNNRHGSVYSN
jgi:hypothetical protein